MTKLGMSLIATSQPESKHEILLCLFMDVHLVVINGHYTSVIIDWSWPCEELLK